MRSAVRIPRAPWCLGTSASRRAVACAGAFASSLALTAVADAQVPVVGSATLATNRACYAEGDLIQFTGSGYGPNAPVVVGLAASHGHGQYKPTTTDAAGAFALTATAPTLDQFGAAPPRVELLSSATDESTSGPDGPTDATLFGITQITLSVRGVVVVPWAATQPAPAPASPSAS